MGIYDCHVHSEHSVDSSSSISALCNRALKLGLCAITITDHSDVPPKERVYPEHIRASVYEANQKKQELSGKLFVLAGVEIGDPLTSENVAYEEIYKIDGIDCILGSVHSKPVIKKYFPQNPYGADIQTSAPKADMDFLKQFMKYYYLELHELVKNVDVDIVTHLTFPLRYINWRANRGIEIKEFYDYIDAILEEIIKRGKTLEVNTSGYAANGDFMPNADILRRYYSMGGRYVSLGSDAHTLDALANGILPAMELLKEIGFKNGSYFVNRVRKEYKL